MMKAPYEWTQVEHNTCRRRAAWPPMWYCLVYILSGSNGRQSRRAFLGAVICNHLALKFKSGTFQFRVWLSVSELRSTLDSPIQLPIDAMSSDRVPISFPLTTTGCYLASSFSFLSACLPSCSSCDPNTMTVRALDGVASSSGKMVVRNRPWMPMWN